MEHPIRKTEERINKFLPSSKIVIEETPMNINNGIVYQFSIVKDGKIELRGYLPLDGLL